MLLPDDAAENLLAGTCRHDKLSPRLARDCRVCVADAFRQAQRQAVIDCYRRMNPTCEKCGEKVHEAKKIFRDVVNIIDTGATKK